MRIPFGPILVSSLVAVIAPVAFAQDFQINAPAGNWQKPGEIRAPSGNWQAPGAVESAAPVPERDAVIQTPGPIRPPVGEITQPGEIQPAAAIEAPAATAGSRSSTSTGSGGNDGTPAVTVQKTDCQERLSMGSDTLFEFNRSDLNPRAEKALQKAGPLILQAGTHPTIVEGHTDGIGSMRYNQTLSEARARAVRDWLVRHHFLPAIAPIRGYGKTRPVAPNVNQDGTDNPAGRQLNRRVEIVIDTCH